MSSTIDLGLVKGPKGDTGADGAPGAKGDKGDKGDTGAPGVGVPAGGGKNSVLIKNSGTDYDTKFEEETSFKNSLGIYSISGGTGLDENDDLDSMRTVGTYYCETDTIASTLVQSPTTKAFVMTVNYANGTHNYIGQTVIETVAGTSYYRSYKKDGGTWTEWAQGGTPDVLPIAHGGTGATTVEQALINLGVTSADQFLNAHPIGSQLLFNYDASSDLLALGGTWSKETSGNAIVTAGTGYAVNSTGGSTTTTLTESQLPNIKGWVQANTNNVKNADGAGFFASSSGCFSLVSFKTNIAYNGSCSVLTDRTVKDEFKINFGSGEAHSNMQPYKCSYLFTRTA